MRTHLPSAKLTGQAIAILMLFAALPTAAKPPVAIGGSYTGEVVVRSLSATRVVVGLDEQGRGLADRLFFVDTAQSMGPFSARSAVSRVEYAAGRLVVVVPSEQRTYVFQVPTTAQGVAPHKLEQATEAEDGSARAELDGGFLQTIGFEVVRVDNAVQLAAYAGMRQRISLVEVRNGSLEGVGPRSLSAATQVPQNQPPPAPDDGSGCRTACSTTCGGGSNCSITCTNGHCASCDCVTGHGASCSCS